MKKHFTKYTSLLLVIALVMMQMAGSVSAYARKDTKIPGLDNLSIEEQNLVLESIISNPSLINFNELSSENQDLVNEVTKNPKQYLAYCTIIHDQVILIYNTFYPNIKIAYTNGHIDVVEQIDENKFIINDEPLFVEYKTEFAPIKPPSFMNPARYAEWVTIPNPGGSWNYLGSVWTDTYLSERIDVITQGALAILLIAVYIPKVIYQIAVSFAYLIKSTMHGYSDRIGYRDYIYHHATISYPVTKKSKISRYIYYSGDFHYEGTSTYYYQYMVY